MASVENVYLVLYCIILGAILLVAYQNTNTNEREYQLSLIILFLLVVSSLLAPSLFLWFILLGIFIIFLQIIGYAMANLFTKIEDRLLVDDESEIWDSFEEAPELKHLQ